MSTLRQLSLLGLVLVILATRSDAADRKFEKKFSVNPGGTLTLKTDVGTVKVTGTSSNEVSVVADIHGRQRMVDGFEISADQTGDGVSVTGRAKEHGSWFFNTSDGIDVEFTVKVPHSYNLQIHTAGGNLYVGDVAGKVNASTSGGEVEASAVEGSLDLRTSGGGVKAARIVGDATLETSGGDVHASQVSGNLSASTSGGNIGISEVGGSIQAETSGGNVIIRVKGSNKGIHAETSGGNIEIAIPRDAGATIDAETSGGDVVCDVPVTVSGRIRESEVKGVVNGGGPTIYAHTSGGDVRIRTLD